MKPLGSPVYKLVLIAIIALFSASCQITYIFKSAVGQVQLLNQRTPITEVIKNPKTPEKVRKKLQLAMEAREFAETELGLTPTDNYQTYVQLDRPYVTYVVSAAERFHLKPYLWGFPILGKLPYKGFFDLESAKEEEKKLKSEGKDTFLRGVSAYSTLGWFDDPLLSSMMRYSEHDLVNTIIHETVHATIYIKDAANFNEQLATFLGNRGTDLFYLKREGEGSPTVQKIKDELSDEKIFSEFISRELKDLKKWYIDNQAGIDEEKKAARLQEIQTRLKAEALPKFKAKSYRSFASTKLNNARLLLYKTYMQDLSKFEKLFAQVNYDYKKFISICKEFENTDDPNKALEEKIK